MSKPEATGGLLTFRSLDLDETEEAVKASEGQVYGWAITNLNDAALYVKFYNATAATVEVGVTVPVITLAVAAGATNSYVGSHGIEFDTAITVACVKEVADNGTTGSDANECVVNIFYK